MNLNWFVGFFEGEGTIDFGISTSTNSIIGIRFGPILSFHQADNGIEDCLKKIQQMLREKGIKSTFNKRKSKNEKWSDTIELSFYGIENCHKLGTLIFPLLESETKLRQMELFLKAIAYMSTRKHYAREGALELMEIIDQLRSYRKPRARKYTKAWVEEFFKTHKPRPKKRKYRKRISKEAIQRAIELRKQGLSYQKIGDELDYSYTTIHKYLKINKSSF